MGRRPLFPLAAALLTLAALGAAWPAAAETRVTFKLTDEPGRWFMNTAGPIAGTQSLAVLEPGGLGRFRGDSATVHTMTSLIFPAGAAGMPFDTRPQKGGDVVLTTPGLYVFTCKIPPYMTPTTCGRTATRR